MNKTILSRYAPLLRYVRELDAARLEAVISRDGRVRADYLMIVMRLVPQTLREICREVR
jgi:hypothetical protein